ncbi:MAG: RsmB/NOP family class I SAM-dependent RNA methyltransferase [Proteobacteria bacterium]|nr:RsmB/NOP family class I SAM-dependent RNA methyltransferase [Pseudomonadota bacterium]
MKPTFESYLASVFGDDLASFLGHGTLGEFIRVNPHRTTIEAVETVLGAYGFETQRVEGVSQALRLLRMPYDPTLCLHHFAGWYVKQSLSSQLPVHFLDPRPGENIIDLCAAPGSKTTQIATAMGHKGCLYANDLAGKRMTPLAARLDATHVSHAVLYNRAAERLTHILPPIFDRVLADVPCSGLGNVMALPENRSRYERAKNPSAMSHLQYRILLTGCRLLRVGGRLVYSTCSLDPHENEAVIQEVVSRLPFRLLEPPDVAGLCLREGLTSWQGETYDASLARCRRVRPWENDTQGFFVAVLEKTDELMPRLRHHDPEANRIQTLGINAPEVAAILENIERYYGVEPEVFAPFRFLVTPRAIHCLDQHWDSVIEGYQRAGTCLAKKRGGIWRMSHTMIQRMGKNIRRNMIWLNDAQMAEICATGEIDVDTLPESPYPVLCYEPLGCLANTYDLGNRRICWKRAYHYHCLPGQMTAGIAPHDGYRKRDI